MAPCVYRMSCEDLEIHQPADTDESKQFLSLDVSSQPNGKEDTDEEDISATNHKQQEKTFLKVAVGHN